MANQVNLTVGQVNEIRNLRDAGPASYPTAYNKIYEWIQPSSDVNSQTKLFFRLAAEVNSNASTAANRYIRLVTKRGLELTPGADSSDAAIQDTSNRIAVAIFTQIINDGGIPQLDTIIRADVTGAVEQGGQTWGGWGGALFFLSERVGPNPTSPESLAKLIFSVREEAKKFETVTIEASLVTLDEYGITADLFDAMRQAVRSGVETVYGINDLNALERTRAYYSLGTIGISVALRGYLSDPGQFRTELQAWLPSDLIPPEVHDLPMVGDGRIVLRGFDATAVQTATAASDILNELAARLPIGGIVFQAADQSTLAWFGSDDANLITATQGVDTIFGGAGADTYRFDTISGNDRINDSDDRGRVIVYGKPIVLALQDASGSYKTPDGALTLTQNSPLTITDGTGGSIVVEDWQAGDLGIRLIDAASAPINPARTFYGDKQNWDSDPNQEGIQAQDDGFGNFIRADGQGRPDIADPDRADVFYGSESNEVERFFTEGGDDTVKADGQFGDVLTTGGRDRIETGAGRDMVAAGAGDDWVEGGTEGDIVIAGAGDDRVYGQGEIALATAIQNAETDTPLTDTGELLAGGEGNDIIVGAATPNVAFGGAGYDAIVGGAADDTIYSDGTLVSASLGWTITRTPTGQGSSRVFSVTLPGTETEDLEATAPGQADAIYGGAGADWVFAGAGDDYVDAGSDDDAILGEAGSDVLIGGAGSDFLDGDSGETAAAGLAGDDYLDGGAGDDILAGEAGDDILYGGIGDDVVSGGAGADVVFGGAGQDVLAGGAGKDTYVFNRGDGTEIVFDLAAGADDPDASVLALGEGITGADITLRLGSLAIDLGGGDAIRFEGFDADDPLSTPLLDSIQFADGTRMSYQEVLDLGFDIDGTEGDDLIEGTAVTDRVDAKGGNDTVIAKAGNDSILGGEGNDDIDAGAGDDVVDAGTGDDIVEAGGGNDTVTTGEGADIVFGGAGDDAVFAGDGDLIVDLEGANTLDLTAFAALTEANLEVTQYEAPDGEAYLNFHVRDDLNPGATPATGGVSVARGELGTFATVTVNDGAGGTVGLAHADLMAQYAGQGFVYGGSAAGETLTGTPFADTFFGEGGADRLEGGAGDDRLDGGAGADTLIGGAGNDSYLLAYNGGRDAVIEDAAAEPAATHTVQLDAGIASTQVRALRVGDDLEVRLKATADALVLKDFYLQPQSWRDGWQVRDGNGVATALADYVPVIPPAPEGWLGEEREAYRARREQVFAANRQAEGYRALGGNSFQRTEQVFSYSGRTASGSTTTLSLGMQSQTSDDAQIEARAEFSSTPLAQTSGSFDIGLPQVRGAGGARGAVASAYGSTGGGGATEFVPLPAGQRGFGGSGVRLEAGDYTIPVYAPRAGGAGNMRNAGGISYANSSAFDDLQQWELVGYRIVRAGGGGEFGRVAAAATYFNYDQRLTVTDLEAGASDNAISALDVSVVEGGAGNDAIALYAFKFDFFTGPDWEGAFDLEALEGSPSAAQARYFEPNAGLFGSPFDSPRANLLGGFAYGGEGDDTIAGSVGQDVLAGGEGADAVEGGGGSDRVLLTAADSGVDTVSDSGLDALAFLDWYYWSRGILNWDERAEHPDEWRLSMDGPGRGYFKTEAEADAAAIENGWFDKTFIPALPEAAPVLTRDDPLYSQLIAEGVLSQDVLEFGPGLALADLDITVTVDSFSAQDYPERPWVNGGQVSIRWGVDGGVDFEAAPVNFGHEGPDLLSGGWKEDDTADGSWRGYRLGEGIEAFRFADGTTLGVDDLLANATVVADTGNYVFERDSGYQLIDRRYAAVQFTDGILAGEIAVKREGLDLLIDAPGGQGRIRNWYADPAAMPETGLLFEFDPPMDAATLTAMGLEVHGFDDADTLIGLDGFDDALFGEWGNDALSGGSGADTLTGGPGDDALAGGAGKDTYVFNRGDGVDSISDAPAGAGDPDASILVFGPDILRGNVLFRLGSLAIDLGEGDAVRLNGFDPGDPLATPVFERLEFDDGSTMTYQEALDQGFDLQGTEGADFISGTAVVDRIQGAGGNDTAAAGAGDDWIFGGDGADLLEGGAGEDGLEGGEGDDTYRFAPGFGRDYIYDFDETPGNEDVIRFAPGIAPAEVSVTRDDVSLYLLLGEGADRVQIDSALSDPAARIERVEFADGTLWTAADLEARIALLPATALDDIFWGTAAADTVNGLDGADSFFGNGGDDLLTGGAGSDYYFFGLGDGADVIDNFDADAEAYDQLTFGPGILPADVALVRSGNDLVLEAGAGDDRVALSDWYLDAEHKIDGVYFGEDGTFWDSAALEQLAPAGASNSAPVVANPLADQAAFEDAAFGFVVPAGAFSEPDAGDVLAYSASLADGSALPAWLSFDAQTRAFSGTPAQADVGSINVRVTATDGGGLFASDNFALTVENVNDAPVVSASDYALLRNEAAAASSLFSVFDEDADAMTQYEFWDDVAGGGYFSLDGVAQGANPVPVTAAELADLQYVGGADPGTERVWVRANDGLEWSAWKPWYMTTALHIPNAAPVVSAAVQQTVLFDQVADAGGLFSVADADGDPITQYEFWDSTAENGYFAVNGVEQGVNVSIPVSAADLANAQFIGASATGSDLVWVRASDGQTWSGWRSWTMNSWPHLTNAAPVVSAADGQLLINDSVSAAGLFSVSDADGDAITQYEFWDDVAGGGYFALDGVAQNNNPIPVSGAELANLEYVAGATPGAERVWARAYDGLEWGAWKPWNMTSALHIPNAAPEVSAASPQTVLLAQSVDASSLFSVTDADNDAISQYEFWDSSAGNGYFAVNGVEQGVNVAIPVSAADLASTRFVGSTDTGSDLVWVRASDGQTWSDWKSWTLNSWPHLTNSAPVASAETSGLLRNEVIAASALFSISDADGDTITQYEFWDDVNGGGYFSVNGVQQAAGQSIPVSASSLASTEYAGGANAGAEQVWVRASDGLAWGPWKNWLMSTEGGMLRGGVGPDTLNGDPDTPVLEGGAGNDALTSGSGNSLLNAGAGDDQVTGGDGNDFLVGGSGNDVLSTGAGYNVIAYNRGDGIDALFGDPAAQNTLSLGGGIRYSDLALRKEGDDLVLDTGNGESINLKDWYLGSTQQTLVKLQLMLDATTEYDANSTDPLLNQRVQEFDFRAMVEAFDQARAADPQVDRWAVMNKLLDAHLAASDTEALGGDLAYYYGINGGLTGISLNAAQQMIGAPGFGQDAQSLRPFTGLQEGLIKLS